jgi:LPXTG-motif cell wall-anchored protein
VDPDEGEPGDVITVGGTNFVAGQTTVSVGGVETDADVTERAPRAVGTELTFVVPDGAEPGPGPLTVTTPAGTSTTDVTFEVLPGEATTSSTATSSPTTTGATDTTPTSSTVSQGTLPRTGTDARQLLALASALIAGGLSVLGLRRRATARPIR